MFYLVLFTTALYTIMYNRKSWENSSVPLIIWQTYKTSKLPGSALKCQKTWKNSNVVYNFMDDIQITEFIRKNFRKDVFVAFENMPLGVMKSDIWRYCVLYKKGGIYSDIDTFLVKPITQWGIESNTKLIIALENDIHFCQWTIVSVPEHPLMIIVINMIVYEFKKGIDLTNPHFVHKHTGPGIWTRAINKLLNMPLEQNAKKTYENTPKDLLDKYGIVFKPSTFFRTDCIKHLHGSTEFNDGYINWTSERDRIVQYAISK